MMLHMQTISNFLNPHREPNHSEISTKPKNQNNHLVFVIINYSNQSNAKIITLH